MLILTAEPGFGRRIPFDQEMGRQAKQFKQGGLPLRGRRAEAAGRDRY